ncbi:unannotated protein [freshwater metagenome]|uniref:Unannotated protein n=1 Tax=freshwater metagenome TaxID=449393 RepID=A0A6J6Q5B9_9ZZZZ
MIPIITSAINTAFAMRIVAHITAAKIPTDKSLRLPLAVSSSRRSDDFTEAMYPRLRVLDALSEQRSRAF